MEGQGRVRVYKTEALILRRRKLGEADSILTLYTPRFGRYDVVAKGVRRPRSRMGGHLDLVRILAASLEIAPLGQAGLPESLGPLTAFLGAVFATAFGVAGGLILTLFIADLGIALLSRTAPQMNVLVLGFQVKTLLVMIALPLTLGVSGALLARLVSTILQALPALIA